MINIILFPLIVVSNEQYKQISKPETGKGMMLVRADVGGRQDKKGEEIKKHKFVVTKQSQGPKLKQAIQ